MHLKYPVKMNNILFIVCVLITFISCSSQRNKEKILPPLPENVTCFKLNPEPFIPHLPKVLNENSGLIYWDRLLWTINDSGGENIIYGFDFSGRIQKEIEIKDASNNDWEEIAQDEKHIFVGDFGNNLGIRKDQKIYVIKKKDIGKETKQKVDSKEIDFGYAEQTNFGFQHFSTPYDCEAMVEYRNSLYIFTKNWQRGTTSVYRLPKEKGKYRLNAIDSFNVQGLVTGADINPDETKLALVGYENFIPFLWLFNGIKADSLFEGSKIRIEMDAMERAQTEGVCFLGNDSLLISCEETKAFDHQVFLLDLKKIDKNGTY